MADSLEVIETRLRLLHPTITTQVNGTDTVHGPGDAEYEDTMDRWAESERQFQLDAEAEAALRELRRQVRVARTRLQQIAGATGTFTNAQRDQATKDIARFLDGLIGVLIDLDLIERE